MGLLAGLGAKLTGTAVIGAAQGVANIIDQFVETADEKRVAETLKERMRQAPHIAQAEINKVEAGHRSLFVAGWRPFIGWVCGVALLWHFMLYDMLVWVQINFFPQTTELPSLTGTETLITVLMALLGLGGMRTLEKFGGKAK
jgi:hypothetical protein